MAYSIIIPSRNIDNLTACVRALRDAGETGRVIVVDDQIEWPFVPGESWGKVTIFGNSPQPFIFARNVNIGINAAGSDDVVLLNDDALLETPRGFADMRIPDEFGIVCCTTNVTGYPQQYRREPKGLRIVPYAAFVAVYIPRRTIDHVGLLDERFGGEGVYGGDDVDYCLRVRQCGLKVGVSDHCFVDHEKLKSTFRPAHPENRGGGDITKSNQLGIEKWGVLWPHRRHV